MPVLAHKLAFGFFLASLVVSLPYIEHLEGHQGYHKNASGHFVLDGELVSTKGGHVILPTSVPVISLTSTSPIPTDSDTTLDTREHATSSFLTLRANKHPPPVKDMIEWLKEEKKWDGKDCVFYTTPTAHESDAEEFATLHFPGSDNGRWFQELFTNDNKEYMLDVWARKEWTDKNKDESDPLILNRMCRALGEYAVSPVYLMIEDGIKPRKDANWQLEAGSLARRKIKVVTVDPYTYKHWDDDFFKHNPDEVKEDDENTSVWKRTGLVNGSEISRRTMPEPPTLADMYIWLRETRKWDGKNAVFYTTPSTDEDRASEFANYLLPGINGGTKGHWFQELFLDPEDGRTQMEDTWGRPTYGAASGDINNKDPVAIARMSAAMGSYARSPVYLLLLEDEVPRPLSFWSRHESGPLRQRNVQVIAYDPDEEKVWNNNFLDVNLNDYVDDGPAHQIN